jgi:hypothetical protein
MDLTFLPALLMSVPESMFKKEGVGGDSTD